MKKSGVLEASEVPSLGNLGRSTSKPAPSFPIFGSLFDWRILDLISI